MDVYNLYAKLCLDSSEYEKGLKDAKSSAGGLTGLFGKVGSVASTVGKGIFNVAAKAILLITYYLIRGLNYQYLL